MSMVSRRRSTASSLATATRRKEKWSNSNSQHPVQRQKNPHTGEYNQRHASARLFVHFRHKVTGSYVSSYSRRQRQRRADSSARQRHNQHARQGGGPHHAGSCPRRRTRLAGRQHYRSHRETLGNLVHEYRKEDQPTQPAGNQESGGNGDAVEKSVDHQPQHYGISAVGVHKLIGMRLFPEVKVRGQGVLEKMDDKIARQNEQWRTRGVQPQAFRQHLR